MRSLDFTYWEKLIGLTRKGAPCWVHLLLSHILIEKTHSRKTVNVITGSQNPQHTYTSITSSVLHRRHREGIITGTGQTCIKASSETEETTRKTWLEKCWHVHCKLSSVHTILLVEVFIFKKFNFGNQIFHFFLWKPHTCLRLWLLLWLRRAPAFFKLFVESGR